MTAIGDAGVDDFKVSFLERRRPDVIVRLLETANMRRSI